jgi:hypothetical protein
MKPNEQLVRMCFEHRREWARQLLASIVVSPAALVDLQDMIQTTYENQPERRLEAARRAAVEIQRMFFGEPEIDAEKPQPSSNEPNAHVGAGVGGDCDVLPGNTGFGGEILIGPRTTTAVPGRVFPEGRDCVPGVAVATCDGPPPGTPEDGAREVFEVVRHWVEKERRWTLNAAPTEDSPRFVEMQRVRILLEALEKFLEHEQRRLQTHGFQSLHWVRNPEGGWHRTLGG